MKRAMAMGIGMMLAGAALVSPASATLIDFSTVRSAPWGMADPNYQPLLSEGVTISLSVPGSSSFIFDRGGVGDGLYMGKGWGSSTPYAMTFSAPVTIDSVYLVGDYNASQNGTWALYTNITDTTPVFTMPVVNNGWNWANALSTAFAPYSITKLVMTVPNGNAAMDDMTVTVAPVPEPATLGLMAGGAALGMLSRRRRQIA